MRQHAANGEIVKTAGGKAPLHGPSGSGVNPPIQSETFVLAGVRESGGRPQRTKARSSSYMEQTMNNVKTFLLMG